MSAFIRWHGSAEELRDRLDRLGSFLTGQEPDQGGIVQQLQLAVGTELLGKVKTAYTDKAEGDTDEMGISWPALAASTLALRHKGTSARVVKKLGDSIPNLPKHRQRLIRQQYLRLVELYRAEEFSSKAGARARRVAQRLLRLMRPHITAARYKKLTKELAKPLRHDQAQALAIAGAFSLILRDTGRLLNSLTPGTKSADQVLESEPGQIAVGSNVDYLKYHQSDRPRKKKRDGTDRLPRRQVLPDDAKPIPPGWWADMLAVYSRGLASQPFWQGFLGNLAA